jgi:hypothetical protein
MNSLSFFGARKRRRERMLRKMANMRAAKERKRLARGPVENEPKYRVVRHPHLSWAVRDDLSGVIVWMPMRSARDTFRRVSALLKYYQPGLPK